MVLTEHVRSLQRYRSYKAYWILNALEFVFWSAVAMLIFQANQSKTGKACHAVACKISWGIVGVAILLM
jgi:hypothetical protein